jgi:tRNA(Arg) A34 adenosine deaminase TadA
VDVSDLAFSFSAELPDWVAEELAAVPEVIPDVDERMAMINRLAGRNFKEKTGGPFAAAVVESRTGKIISIGVNLVLATNLSATHAEVVALSLAQTRLRNWDLGAAELEDHELMVNWRPCAQCYGAVLWSGVKKLIIAGAGPVVEELTGFDEGPLRDDWDDQLRDRGIEVISDVGRDDALAVFRNYRRAVRLGDVTVYNARNSGAISA